jgi:hypothetical protein
VLAARILPSNNLTDPQYSSAYWTAARCLGFASIGRWNAWTKLGATVVVLPIGIDAEFGVSVQVASHQLPLISKPQNHVLQALSENRMLGALHERPTLRDDCDCSRARGSTVDGRIDESIDGHSARAD